MTKNEKNGIKEKDEIKLRIPQLEEGYVGRDWKKFFTIIAFFFIILIAWYVLKAISMK